MGDKWHSGILHRYAHAFLVDNKPDIECLRKFIVWSSRGDFVAEECAQYFDEMLSSFEPKSSKYVTYRRLLWEILEKCFEKSRKQTVIMGILVSDWHGNNPKVRAITLRAMTKLPRQRINEVFFCFRSAVEDQDSVVVTTALSCLPLIARKTGLTSEIEVLFMNAARHNDPKVVAAAVCGYVEFTDHSKYDILVPAVVNKLLVSLKTLEKWSLIGVLDALGNFHPKCDEDAQSIITFVAEFFGNGSEAVGMSALNCALKLLEFVENDDVIYSVKVEILGTMMHLLSLNNMFVNSVCQAIFLFLNKYKDMRNVDHECFYITSRDNNELKISKLSILELIINVTNAKPVLHHICDWIRVETDDNVLRKCMKLVHLIGLWFDFIARTLVDSIMEFTEMKNKVVIIEIFKILCDITRIHPEKFDIHIRDLFKGVDVIADMREAHPMILYFIGEFPINTPNSRARLIKYCKDFEHHDSEIQLITLTTIAKMFLRGYDDEGIEDMLNKVITYSLHSKNIELRERGTFYANLFTLGRDKAKEIVLKKPDTRFDRECMNPRPSVDHITSITSISALVCHEEQPAERQIRKDTKVDESSLKFKFIVDSHTGCNVGFAVGICEGRPVLHILVDNSVSRCSYVRQIYIASNECGIDLSATDQLPHPMTQKSRKIFTFSFRYNPMNRAKQMDPTHINLVVDIGQHEVIIPVQLDISFLISPDLTGLTGLRHSKYTELWNDTNCDDGATTEMSPQTNIGMVRHYLDNVHIPFSCIVDNTCYFIGRGILSLVFVTITKTAFSYVVTVLSSAKPFSEKILENIVRLSSA